MANEMIRARLKKSGVHQYQLADALGVSESTLVRWLRKELSESKRKEIIGLVDKIMKEERA